MRTVICFPELTIWRNECRNEATLWKRWEPGFRSQPEPQEFPCRNEATLWKRWEHHVPGAPHYYFLAGVGMKPLSERDENYISWILAIFWKEDVGMKPLSERDENTLSTIRNFLKNSTCRNEATLWKRWEQIVYHCRNFHYLASRNEATLWKRWELPNLISTIMKYGFM